MGRQSAGTGWRRPVWLLLVALVLAGCGSDSGSGSSGGGDTAQPGNKAAAEELVKQSTAAQTEWQGPTSAPKPVTGKTVGIIPCGLAIEGCAREARGAEEAAKAIGWTPVVVDGQGNPATIQQGMDSLITRKVDAIILASVNAQDVGTQLARAKSANVAVIATFASDPKPQGGLGVVGIDDFQAGRAVGAYMVSQGGGGVVVFTQNEAPAVAARAEGLKAALREFGGSDTRIVEEQSISNTQLGAPEEQIMSAILQRHPKGELAWIYAGFDFMLTPLVNAANRAGRTELRGASFDGNLENLDFIRADNIQVVSVGYPLEWAGWGAIDQLNRHFQGQPLVDQGVRFKLLTKDNLPPEGQSYTGDVDFRQRYRSLWGLTS
jgi:ribose transport system substrate-binding protein